MRIAEILYSIASWLENPDNEALILAESNEECLKVVAESCVSAAQTLKIAAQHVDNIEPLDDSHINSESLEGLANLATALDSSNDEKLKKQASVIDELLLTIASNPEMLKEKRAADNQRIEELKKKYDSAKGTLDSINKIDDSTKALEKASVMKQSVIMDQPLSARSCPDHPGTQIARVGEHIWQCSLDKKIYNFDEGFTLNNGNTVPGGDVSLQTKVDGDKSSHSLYDTRDGRLGLNS